MTTKQEINKPLEELDLEQLQFVLDNLDNFSDVELRGLDTSTGATVEAVQKEDCQKNFMDFAHKVWPNFIDGEHHAKMAAAFEKVARGEIKRLIINMPPRHTKSEFASYLLPAWFLGKFPEKKVIQTSHTAELAVGFGRKVRNLVDSDIYKSIFPGVGLQADSKAAGRWATNKGGDYFAIGIGGAVTGKGADILIIDDPHSEQEAALSETNPEVYDKTYEWYTSGPRQRLQPGGAIIIVMTRWSKKDLTGRVIKADAQRGGEGWEVIEFPAIKEDGTALWPEFWDVEELLAKKAALDIRYWNAQYMQKPTSEEGALIKREWWQTWEKDDPPNCEFVIMSLDAAQEAKNRSDYNALTVWGVFHNEETKAFNIILLNSIKKRMEYPELKKMVLEEYKEWNPDSFIVEKKSNGAVLYQEMRRMGVPLMEFTPGKGQDKISRVNAVSDMFQSGMVWAPDRRWAHEVIEECNDFPAGLNDDLVDSTTQALLRFRQGGFIRLPTDEPDDIKWFKGYRRERYYTV